MDISDPYKAAAFAAYAAFGLIFPKAQGHYDAQGHFIVTAARAAAIHECSARAAQYPEWEYGNTEFYIYRACMAEHGEPE
ncbi:hypothetical protein [Pseudorhodoplanes sinuspersici]|uniref:Uncharacterized protein n=1 Tax=Pseudorhodoplanes sinuspersici TaxID=1235591 RepID=A0A1W6ZL16_9HYPH|nr:hypothetical protein [Pseudorhodoplanes sinuspersici]ARP97937.1 hypothetical protein CAK95_01730 [Pseudorhodoplanes sinuspersici]RKE68319.1 hypothetical protein DFP91_4695 [Pseudorhodoplanes sinuspersici]